jgi:diguanylate cyclase (GGDEF)-like protein
MLELQNTILEMVAKGEALKPTTDRLCIEIEKLLPSVVCSILRLDRSDRLRPLSGPRLPEAYSTAIDGVAIGPMIGSCGSSAYLRAPVAVTDIEIDARWIDFKELPLKQGLKACWSSPIFGADNRVLGTFAFYYHENRGPTAAEQRIVDTCVHLCAIALERHERVLERERLARTDALTGLPNRASFDTTLSSLRRDRAGAWALLLLDLDNLKVVNDTFGHQTGDDLLKVVASRLIEAAAPHVVFRLGGDEFAVLVRGTRSTQTIDEIARRVRDAMTEPASCGGHLVVPAATMGAAVVTTGDNPETVRRNADLALYHAKETDRGGFARHSSRLATAMTRREAAIRDVAEALGSDRIDAYYQPIVRLDNGKIVGVEALSRLIRGDGEVVPAALFHEATFDARIASQLTHRMLNIVAGDVRKWLQAGIPFQHVGINVCSADFHSGKLCTQLADAFEGQNLSLEHVILEVTESVYMSQQDTVVPRTIKAMRAKGLRIALDDFGTGFASLTHLFTVPVDVIKIDKSFIDRLTRGDASAIVVEGLIGIARRLGIRVIAEGVETERQASLLREFGCTQCQGFLFSKAVHRDEATAKLLRLAETPSDSLGALVPEVSSAMHREPLAGKNSETTESRPRRRRPALG